MAVRAPRRPEEPPPVRRALAYVGAWTTVELLCAAHPWRHDHSDAERRAARLVLRERGYPAPLALLLVVLTLPAVRDAWDGGAGLPDVLRGWAAVVLVATGIAAPVLARRAGGGTVRAAVMGGALVSVLLFAGAWVGNRRRVRRRRTPTGRGHGADATG